MDQWINDTLNTKIRPILYFYVDKYRNKKVHDYDKLDILYAFSIFEILFKSINIVVANYYLVSMSSIDAFLSINQ